MDVPPTPHPIRGDRKRDWIQDGGPDTSTGGVGRYGAGLGGLAGRAWSGWPSELLGNLGMGVRPVSRVTRHPGGVHLGGGPDQYAIDASSAERRALDRRNVSIR